MPRIGVWGIGRGRVEKQRLRVVTSRKYSRAVSEYSESESASVVECRLLMTESSYNCRTRSMNESWAYGAPDTEQRERVSKKKNGRETR